MTKHEKQERNAFMNALMLYNKDITEEKARSIIRYMITNEKRLRYMAIMQASDADYCKKHSDGNGNYPDREHLEDLVLAFIKKNIGCKAYICGDPRGMQIRLYLNNKQTHHFVNSFDGETAGVCWEI